MQKKSSTAREKDTSSEKGLSDKDYLELGHLAELITGILANKHTPEILRIAILEGLARLDCHAEINHNAGYVGAILVTDAICRKGGAR
jgi:hypothetical protein